MSLWHVQPNDDFIVRGKVTKEDEPVTVDHNDLGHRGCSHYTLQTHKTTNSYKTLAVFSISTMSSQAGRPDIR